jgi:ApbE superfamily uncharacterized protein (UPF0280 family)
MEVLKTVEVEGKEVKTVSKEQLKAIQDHQAKLNALLVDVGYLESKKMEVLGMYAETSKAMNEVKTDLEKEYGAINIDLKDGSYTDVVKEE